jgi:hypothetical protein
MKSIMSVLVVTIMAFGLVSSSVAGSLPFCCNANSGNVTAKGADNCPVFGCNPVHSPTWFPYRCGLQGSAYTDYIDAVALPCTARDRDASTRVSEPMGSRR